MAGDVVDNGPGALSVPRGSSVGCLVTGGGVVALGLLFCMAVVMFYVVISGGERDVDVLLSEQRAEFDYVGDVIENKAMSIYREDYTSRQFIDFYRDGVSTVHPLLLKYSDDLMCCGLTAGASMGFQAVVAADGAVDLRDLWVRDADDICIREVFDGMSAQDLAPPSGHIAMTVFASGNDLEHYAYNARVDEHSEIPVTSSIGHGILQSDGLSRLFASSADGGQALFVMSQQDDERLYMLNKVLSCPDSEHAVTRLSGSVSYGDKIPWITVETSPKVPCVESSFREHWDDLVPIFDTDNLTDIDHVNIVFDVVLQPVRVP